MKKIVVLFAALALFAAACGGGGSDDESSSSSDDESSSSSDDESSSGSDSASGSADDWCDFDAQREALNEEFEDDAIFTQEGAEEAFSRFRDLTDDIVDAAPEEIEDDVAVMADAFNSFIDDLEDADWDFLALTEAQLAALDTPEVAEAQANMDAYTAANCGTSSSDSDSDTGDEPADEPTDEPEVEEEPADDADSDSSEDSGDDPESEIDSTLRQVLVDSFVQSGMTEEQANCMIDKVNLQDLASGEFDPLEFLDFYEQCGVDFTQLN